MISRHHEPEFSTWDALTDRMPCRACGQPVVAATWAMTECPGPEPQDTLPRDDYAVDLPTHYWPAAQAEVETWPVLTCPTCGRQHAHPPAVTATYWPTCFQCWKSTARSQEEDF